MSSRRFNDRDEETSPRNPLLPGEEINGVAFSRGGGLGNVARNVFVLVPPILAELPIIYHLSVGRVERLECGSCGSARD